MKIFSHYIWESEGVEKANSSAVILQQVKVKNKCCLLACVCDGKEGGEEGIYIAGNFTEHLVEWFHRQCIPMINQARKAERIPQLLEKEIKSMPVFDLSGMLVWGDQFCYFEKGEAKSFLFNRRFNKKQCRNLSQMLFGKDRVSKDSVGKERGGKLLMISGTLQKGISVLISTAGFCEHISEKELLEVLFEEKAKDGEIHKRLKELWKEDMVRGGAKYAGAVFFRVG